MYWIWAFGQALKILTKVGFIREPPPKMGILFEAGHLYRACLG
jgi:hypothetical protein